MRNTSSKIVERFVLLWVLIGLAALAAEALAQGRAANNSPRVTKLRNDAQFVRDSWTADNGLPQNSVQAIVQGREGYIWVGTQEGVARFDGVRFISPQNHNSYVNKNLSVKSLLAASDGSLWLGMESGLTRLKNGEPSSYTTESGLPNNYVTALLEDRDGAIWIGTRGGVARFHSGVFTRGIVESGMGESWISAIVRTRDGALWFGGKQGLTRFKDGSLEHFGMSDNLMINRITALFEDKAGTLWIGSEYQGILQYKDGRISSFSPKNGDGDFSRTSIHDFQEDADGRMWIATRNGLRLYDGHELIDYSKRDPLFDGYISALCLDQEGTLWAGSLETGLLRLRKPKFPVYGVPEGIAGDFISCVIEDRRGSLWIGSYQKGVDQIQGNEIIHWDATNGLPGNSVSSMLETRDGVVWIATEHGLAAYRDGKFEVYTRADGLVDNMVYAIQEDVHGGLWLGTSRGVSYFRNGKFDNSWNREGIEGSVIRELLVARDGTVWIPTTTNGMFRIRDGQIQAFSNRNGLPSNQVLSLYEDHAGDLWAGCVNGGLARFRGDKITVYGAEQGFNEKVVNAIMEDDLGAYWVTSNHGIFRFEKSQFDDYDQGRSKQLAYLVYGAADGMRSTDTSGGAQPSSWKTRDGRLLFPTLKGLVMIDPRDLRPRIVAPPTRIEAILADNRVVSLDGEAVLEPGVRVLEIQYTGLDLLMAHKIQFRYKLEGFDADWNMVGTRRTAFYNNLPPGRYKFTVAAKDENGNWNESPTSVVFHLKPHFYQTWSFYVGIVLILGLLIRGWHHYRVSVANENNLRSIALHQPTSMMVFSPAGEVVMVNCRFTETFGYTQNDIPTIRAWAEQAYPDPKYRQKNVQYWKQSYLASSDPMDHKEFQERRITCKDGSLREAEMHFTRLHDFHIVTLNDVTERKQTEEALRQSEKQLRALATRMEAVREEERSYISREIHEDIGQYLTGITLDLKSLANRIPPGSDDLRKRADSLQELVNETIQSVRNLATSFRPTALDHLSLVDALEWQTRDFQTRSGIHCEIVEKPPALLATRDLSVTFFRIYQETLNNICKQGQAKNVMTRIRQEEGRIILEVLSDGKILPAEDSKQALALEFVGIRERALRLGGDIQILDHSDDRTILRTSLPFDGSSPSLPITPENVRSVSSTRKS